MGPFPKISIERKTVSGRLVSLPIRQLASPRDAADDLHVDLFGHVEDFEQRDDGFVREVLEFRRIGDDRIRLARLRLRPTRRVNSLARGRESATDRLVSLPQSGR
jgi:hypothetical protein